MTISGVINLLFCHCLLSYIPPYIAGVWLKYQLTYWLIWSVSAYYYYSVCKLFPIVHFIIAGQVWRPARLIKAGVGFVAY